MACPSPYRKSAIKPWCKGAPNAKREAVASATASLCKRFYLILFYTISIRVSKGVDLSDLSVAHVAFNRVFASEAIAAEYLDSIGGDLHSYVRSVFLSDSCVYGVGFNVGLSHFPSCFVDSEASRFDFEFHVSEHEADSLEFSDRFAELCTFFSILNSCIVSAFRNAESLCANANTAAVEGHHSDLEAFAFFAEEVFSRNFYVLEYEFTLDLSVEANTTVTSASPPLVLKTLEPFKV